MKEKHKAMENLKDHTIKHLHTITGGDTAVSNATTDLPRDRNNVQNPFRALYDYKPYTTPF